MTLLSVTKCCSGAPSDFARVSFESVQNPCMPLRSILVALTCLSVAFASGCKGKSDGAADPAASAEPAPMSASGLVEERDDGRLTWIVMSDGRVRAIATKEGAAAWTGTLTVAGQAIPMTADGPTLSANIPKLTEDLTEIGYSIKTGEVAWEGTLHIPPGGTDELIKPTAVTIPEGTKGPHGGVLDVVGDQRVEIVTDEKTGEVRVYLLNEKLEPIPVGSGTAVLGVVQ